MSNTGIAVRSFKDQTGIITRTGLKVLRLVRTRPTPAYATKCEACGAETNVEHSRIEFAECQSANHGKTQRGDRMSERAESFARARERNDEERRLANLRMEQATADYKMPQRRPLVAGNDSPASERQRIERREWAEEMDREEQERQRPIEEAAEQLNATHRQLRAAQRERLVNLELEDVDLFISPEVAGASMPQSHAKEHNILEWQKFHRQHPDFYPSNRNISLLHDYHVKNHAEIYTAEMLSRVFVRMKDAGVEFDQAPPPEPEPMDYSKREAVEVHISKPTKPEPVTYEGWDDEGNEVKYTERQVNRMSSTEMRRKLRLGKEDLSLRSISPFNRDSE